MSERKALVRLTGWAAALTVMAAEMAIVWSVLP